ncbi:MAG TPA: D-alanyl-D-alanine carboxypeptidase/D-alanyl-D-alanine-endopeptidase [Candidatus Angelobacter sp.]
MLPPRHSVRALVALVLLTSLHFVAAEPAQAPKTPLRKTLAEQIQAILSQPHLARAHWGIDVVELESGKIIYSLNPEELFLPASNAKLFTTAAALSAAGADYRFNTTVETAGTMDENGRLVGDLVIVGRGDPNLSGRVLPYALKTERTPAPMPILEEMADQVVARGLKIVDGDLIGDDTFYSPERYAPGWAQDDLQWIDGAPVSALTLNDNVVVVDIQPGAHADDKALVTLEPETNYYDIDNRIVTAPPSVARKIGMRREPDSKTLVLWGWLPLGEAGMKEALAIEDPAEFTAQLFRSLLERRGVVITGKTRSRHGDIAQFFDLETTPPSPGDSGTKARRCCSPAAQPAPKPEPRPQDSSVSSAAATAAARPPTRAALVLAQHISLPFIEDLRVTNKTSQNLHAELALRLTGRLGGQGGSFAGGEAAVKQFLLRAGLKEEEFVLLDGSGLSRRDLVTPSAVTRLLVYAARQPWGAAYEETLPVAGVDGSLSERFLNSPAAGLVHAKTGTLSHVSALSGYGQTLAGKRFAFSIFCNNYNLPAAKVVPAIDAIVRLLVAEQDSAK